MAADVLNIKFSNTPAFIFISGPQGVGKTKICADLATSFKDQGKKVTIISLDDFYLPFEEQQALAAKGNPLLKYRGLPGTHDIQLSLNCFENLANGNPVAIPKYEKSLNHGWGDRLPASKWEYVSSPVDIVIFEGWCLGFKHLPHDYHFQDYGAYSAADLKEVNENLIELEKLYKFADAFIQYKAKDIEYVFDWRWEQELGLKRKHGQNSGLSRMEVNDFVSRFMPIYHYYLPGLESGFRSSRVEFTIQFIVDHQRTVIGQKNL